MRQSMWMLLGAMLVAALAAAAQAELVVVNSAGAAWLLNDDLTTKAQEPEGWFPNTVDVAGLANGSFVVASTYNNGTLWLRSPDLIHGPYDRSNLGAFQTTSVVGTRSGNIVAGTTDDHLYVLGPDLSTLHDLTGPGDVTVSATELADGKVLTASAIIGGYLNLKHGDLSYAAGWDGFGTGMHVLGLSTGNVLASNAEGWLRVRSGNDLSHVYESDGYLPISAIAEFADGKIAAVNSNGRLFVRNADLSYYAQMDGFGSVPKVAALPNGLLAIPNAAGELRLVDSSGIGHGYNSGYGTIVSIGYVVPEPSVIVLLGTGLMGLLACVWRKRR